MLEGTDEFNIWDRFFVDIRLIDNLSNYGYKWGYPTSSTDQHKWFMPENRKKIADELIKI